MDFSDSPKARPSFILSLDVAAFILVSWVVSHAKKDNVTLGQCKKKKKMVSRHFSIKLQIPSVPPSSLPGHTRQGPFTGYLEQASSVTPPKIAPNARVERRVTYQR